MFNQKCGISREGETRWTVGIGVDRDYIAHTISLSQQSYIDDLVERFGLQNATTPLEPTALFTKDQCPTIPAEFRDMFGNNHRELIASL